MKKTAFLFVASLCAAAHADILVSDSFTYPDGNLVGNGTWAAHSGAGTNPVQVISGQAQLTQVGSAEDVNAPFAPLAAGGTVYAGFDVTNSGANTAVYFAHFLQGTSTFRGRVFIVPAVAGGDFTFAVSDTATANQVWPSDFAYGSTHRLIVAYSYDTGATTLWVDPVDMSSPSLTLTGTASTAVAGFALRQSSGGSTQLIDNLIVATTFGEAIPAPGTAALMLAGFAIAGRRRR